LRRDLCTEAGRLFLERYGQLIELSERIDAGETITELARDYSLSEAEIEQAVLYEQAA
jgi:hypothetical protein